MYKKWIISGAIIGAVYLYAINWIDNTFGLLGFVLEITNLPALIIAQSIGGIIGVAFKSPLVITIINTFLGIWLADFLYSLFHKTFNLKRVGTYLLIIVALGAIYIAGNQDLINKNSRNCEQISNPNMAGTCYMSKAIETNNIEECKNIPLINGFSGERVSCYSSIAKQNTNPAMCTAITADSDLASREGIELSVERCVEEIKQ